MKEYFRSQKIKEELANNKGTTEVCAMSNVKATKFCLNSCGTNMENCQNGWVSKKIGA